MSVGQLEIKQQNGYVLLQKPGFSEAPSLV